MTGAAERGGALILTADLPPDLHAWATALRTAHFPPERNHLAAHVTLFHALPEPYHAEIDRLLKAQTKLEAPIPARLVGLMSLGGGTALKLESPDLMDLRRDVAERMFDLLTAQDRNTPRLHVTIQNKVSSTKAKALQAELDGTIAPRDFRFPSISLHRYLGGPWEKLATYRFRG